MSSFEQTRSEAHTGNRTKVTRVEISEGVHREIDAEKRRKESEERMAEKANRMGTCKTRIATLIIKGSTDRINGVTYNPNVFEDKHDQEAYKEGFINHGNREILGKLGELTSEQLQKIGTNDYISGISPEEIPDKLKENESYALGQIMGPIYSNQNTETHRRGK